MMGLVLMEDGNFSQNCKQVGLGKAVGGRAKGDVAFAYLICLPATEDDNTNFACRGRSLRVSNLDLSCLDGQSIEARLTDFLFSIERH